MTSRKGAVPWTHASRAAAAQKAWETKRQRGHTRSGVTPYVPTGTRPATSTRNPGTFALGQVYNFGPKGRFRKTTKGWIRVPD